MDQLTSTAKQVTQGDQLKELVLYVAFGLTALGIELFTFYLTVEILLWGLLVANLASIISGMIVSFGLNAVFNFKVNDQIGKRFAQYSVVVGIGYLLSSIIILSLVELSIAPVMAKVVALPFVFIVQFSLNKRFAFSN